MAKNYFRYQLPSTAPPNKDLIYFPYWRFKGMLFSCTPADVKFQFLDISRQAIPSRLMPVNVGFRSQALKLKFVSPESAGQFLKPQLTFDEVIQHFEERFSKSLPKPILHQSRVGDTVSLLYAPFYVEDRLFDAVLNKPITSNVPDDLNPVEFPGEKPDWQLHFVATLCPNCGWDLSGERDALVLLCKNCNSAWYPVGKKLKKIKFGRFPQEVDNVHYLPYWRIKASISEIQLHSYGDLVHVANLPRANQPGWDEIPFRFWIPAFKIRPKVFLRLASSMTLTHPHGKLLEELPGDNHHPVTLPVQEAIESLKITLASFMRPRKNIIEKIPEIKIKPESFVLVYMPFEEKHYEYVQPHFQMAINKNMLVLSKHL